MKSPFSTHSKIVRAAAIAAALAGAFGAAQAASYTSAPLVNDMTGRCCGPAGTDGDITYTPHGPDDTGWMPFPPTSNPIPGFLLGIDPNFGAKYQVDSLFFTVKAAVAASPEGGGTSAWDFLVGDGAGGPIDTFHLQLTNYQTESFTTTPASASFQRALNGGLQIRLVETTDGIDHLHLFNYKVYVKYSDLAPPVPEPAEWAMLVAGLVVIGFMGARRQKRSSA
jgi:hypothetical protein